MNNIKSIVIAIMGALSAFFVLVIQRKNRAIDKQKQVIKEQDQHIKTQEFINDAENKTTIKKNDAAHMSDDDIERMFKQNKWLDD